MENNQEFINEELNDVMAKMPSSFIRYGTIVISCIFISFLLLSYLIKIPEKIVSEVYISSINEAEKMTSKSDSKIENLLVNPGDRVKKGDYIIIFENTADYNDVLKLKEKIETIKDFDQLEIQLKETTLKLGEIQTVFNSFETSLLNHRLNRINKDIHNLDERESSIDQTETKKRIETIKLQIKNSENEYQLKLKEFDRFEKLFSKGVISQQEFENKKVELSIFQKNIKNYNQELSNLTTRTNQIDTERGQSKLNFEKNSIQTLEQLKIAIKNLKKSISDWEFNYVIKSNFDGKANFVEFIYKGKNTLANQHLITIEPLTNKGYIGHAKTNSTKLTELKPGQTAKIKLHNYPYKDYGVIKGNVKNISKTIDDEGNIRFDITISHNLITSFDKKIDYKSGLKGIAEIKIDEKRLLYKLIKIFDFSEEF